MLSLFQQKIRYQRDKRETANGERGKKRVSRSFICLSLLWYELLFGSAPAYLKRQHMIRKNCCLNKDLTKRMQDSCAMLHFPSTHLISDPSSFINCAPPSSSMSNKKSSTINLNGHGPLRNSPLPIIHASLWERKSFYYANRRVDAEECREHKSLCATKYRLVSLMVDFHVWLGSDLWSSNNVM